MEMIQEISEREALSLFKGWFHNKMTIILIMIRYPHLGKRCAKIENQVGFLHDIKHHFLRKRIERKAFYDAIRWLKAFFRIYPDGVTEKRSDRALAMVKLVYDAFGFPFFWGHTEIDMSVKQ